MITDHSPVQFKTFGGLYGRNDDECPITHLLTALNVEFVRDDLRSRKGSVLESTIANVKRIRLFKKIGEATRAIILNGSGQFFDSSVSLTVPILTIGAATDFALLNYYNRCYISPNNGVTGLPGQAVYVYDGTTCRKAAGAAPSGFTLSAVTSALSGDVEAGLHIIAVAFETASGYITKPGPAIYTVYLAPGGYKIDLSNIPIGPAGTVARHILTTELFTEYSGKQEEYELFKIARIPNNTDTTYTLDFADNQLLATADDLVDQYEEIPAGVGLSTYGGRMLVYGIQGNDSVVLASKAGEPEAISSVDGLIATNPKDNSGVKNVRQYRDILYILKSNNTYSTQDNGNTPDTWTVSNVDDGIGCEPEGIADVLDAKGISTDRAFIAARHGLVLFTGSYEIDPLTWKIDSWWKRINKAQFHKVQIIQDPINAVIYIAVPLDDAVNCSHLFVGYYGNTSAAGFKWSVWQFNHVPTCIAVDTDFNSFSTTFRYGSIDGNVYKLSSSATSDAGVAFTTTVRFPFVPIESEDNMIHLGGIRARLMGNGIVNIKVYGMDDAKSENYPSWVITALPGMPYFRETNFEHEKVSIEFSMTNIDNYMIIKRVTAFLSSIWMQRPA